jgi:hypothetical protein
MVRSYLRISRRFLDDAEMAKRMQLPTTGKKCLCRAAAAAAAAAAPFPAAAVAPSCQ